MKAGVVEEESCVGVGVGSVGGIVEDEGGANVVAITVISVSQCLPV
jgi:hypothetical protein